MSPAGQFLPTRQAVVFRHTRRAIDATSLCLIKFAMTVVEVYVQQLAPDQRRVPFRLGLSGRDLIKAAEHNAQQVGRYLDGTIKTFPAELEDAWVMALPEPYRGDCERELAARRGHLPVALPPAACSSITTNALAEMTRGFSELLGAAAPVLENGTIDARDHRALLQRLVSEGQEMIACVWAVSLQAEAQLAPGKDALQDNGTRK